MAFALALVAFPLHAETLRVLFIGNSLTYSNDLPRIVEALARGGEVEIEAGMIAFPNAGLEDLWHDGRARREIASRRWDAVVMQQGPSSLASSRAELVAWAGRFATEAKAAGARPALYTVWPDSTRRAYFGEVIESYRVAAEACGCELLPAGLAWKEAWARSRRLSLYGADGFHPSEEGSYLAALVIWGGLTGADVAAAPSTLELSNGRTLKVKEERAAVYREAATAALATQHQQRGTMGNTSGADASESSSDAPLPTPHGRRRDEHERSAQIEPARRDVDRDRARIETFGDSRGSVTAFRS